MRVAFYFVIAPASTTVRIGLVSPDEAACWQLGRLAAAWPDGPATVELLSAHEAPAWTTAERPVWQAVLVDLRADAEFSAEWRQRLNALGPVPIVLLIDRERPECEEFEYSWWPLESPDALRSALRRARRLVTLQAEMAQLRAERESQRLARHQVERARERQERLMQGIMRSLPLIIGRLDHRGRVVEVHGSGLARCGILPEQLWRRRLGFALPQARPSVRQALQGETAAFSLRGRTGDYESHADFAIMPDSPGERGAIFLGRDVSERRWLEHQLLTVSEAEQRRIGADLHDGLGQQLTGLACLVAALRDRLKEQDENLATQADFIVEVANDATRQSRALARGLCPVQLEGASLESALGDLVYQAQQLHGINCHFRSRGQMGPLDHFTAIHLYRITQEALHNAVRHGNARNVSVTVVSRGPRHRLTIADDGRGFDSRQAAPLSSRGLRLMQYRAGMIGGALSIITRPGRGTRVLCQFLHTPSPHEEPSRSTSESTAQESH